MRSGEFLAKIGEHPRLEYVGILNDEVVIRFTPFDNVSSRGKHRILWALVPASILDTDWEQLLEVLLGNRSPTIMKRIIHTVVYYDYLRNWNKSKIAELADRHDGNYGLSEVIEVPA